MTIFQQKLTRIALCCAFSLPFFSLSLSAATYTYTEMRGSTWSTESAWEGRIMPPTNLAAGDEVIIRGYCDLDMDIQFERGANFVITADATLFSSHNVGVNNYGKLVIEGTFIADGMVVNNYGEIFCNPATRSMLLSERGNATWNNFGTITIEGGTEFRQNNGEFINNVGATLHINGTYLHTDGGFSQEGTLKGIGNLDISASTMREFVNSGTFAPGNSPGTFEVKGDFHNRRKLEIELGGSERGLDYDFVIVNGKATIDGTLEIKFVNGYVPHNGEKFSIMQHTSISGRFSSIVVPNGFQIGFLEYRSNEIVLTLTASVLPVEWGNFSAEKRENGVQLQWSTQSEINSKGVTIQHSTDGSTWTNLGFVKSNGKASEYVFDHKNPENVNYYRLEQMDFDGKTAVSKVISIQFDASKHPLSIFPNPATDVAHIRFDAAEKADIHIMDIAGKIIFQETAAQTGLLEWHTEGVARGMYFVVLTTNTARIVKKLVVK